MLTPQLQKYLDMNLFEELGMQTLTPVQRTQFLDAFGRVIHERVMLKLMDVMTPEQKQDFDTFLAGKPGDDATAEYLQSHVPNLDDIVHEEVAEYKRYLAEEYKSGLETIDDEIKKVLNGVPPAE